MNQQTIRTAVRRPPPIDAAEWDELDADQWDDALHPPVACEALFRASERRAHSDAARALFSL